jgi:hypothetical protein
MKLKSLITIALSSLLLVGCSTVSSLVTPTALTSSVATGVQVGLDVYPAAAPEVALARDVICADASKTNTNPQAIVNDLSALGIADSNAKLIVDGALLAYDGVYLLIGTNADTKMEPYLTALCAGLTAGLPPPASAAVKASRPATAILPPHLK